MRRCQVEHNSEIAVALPTLISSMRCAAGCFSLGLELRRTRCPLLDGRDDCPAHLQVPAHPARREGGQFQHILLEGRGYSYAAHRQAELGLADPAAVEAAQALMDN